MQNWPRAWVPFFDDFIPGWVKREYSHHEASKHKQFNDQDARFFFKGIEELSDLFTVERSHKIPPYFRHPRFRSSYLLYFLPLQAAKFLTIFHLHSEGIQAMLEHARKAGVLRIADLGAGPGTASLALLLALSDMDPKDIPPIELTWIDTEEAILKDGKKILTEWLKGLPIFESVKIRFEVDLWYKAPKILAEPHSIIFLGNVLNESPKFDIDYVSALYEITGGGGVLAVEPAAKGPSQLLSSIREEVFESGLLPRDAKHILGPCLHAERCPLIQGRDWCHFSVKASPPGQVFKIFSKMLGSEREWLKFSYLWMTPEGLNSLKARKGVRVVSDPLTHQGAKEVLTCLPETVGRYRLKEGERLYRGDLIYPPRSTSKSSLK